MRPGGKTIGEQIDAAVADAVTRLGEPDAEHLTVWSRDHMFGDASLGLGGAAAQAVCTAQVTIIIGEGRWLRYHGGRFAAEGTGAPEWHPSETEEAGDA